MKISAISFTYHDVPFVTNTDNHMRYWLPHWRITQICSITLDSGVTGWGETIPNYTWGRPSEEECKHLVGENPADLLWQDELGAGVQMALFDAVGKALGVPVYSLLGKKHREWCPISWWAIDMPPSDWAQQCRDAVAQGYVSAKLKARTWCDLFAALDAAIEVVPGTFKFDLDFNATLGNSANAIPILDRLKERSQVAFVETPIPQTDVAGNASVRLTTGMPTAMHFGSPPIITTLKEDLTDGFVLSGGARTLINDAAILAKANKPFWLQLVGTGLTTTWAAHLGTVLETATWPAVTCLNIWESQLIRPSIEVHGGFHRVPEKPGLGVEIDRKALEEYQVDYDFVALPRHVYRYDRKAGPSTYYDCGRQDLHQVYVRDAQPICEPESTLTPVDDDGSEEFQRMPASARS